MLERIAYSDKGYIGFSRKAKKIKPAAKPIGSEIPEYITKGTRSQDWIDRYVKNHSGYIAKKEGLIKGALIGIAALGTILGSTAAINKAVNKVPNTTTITDADRKDMRNIAQAYGIPAEALEAYNETIGNDVEITSEVEVPSNFDYLQKEIDAIEEKLYKNPDSYSEMRSELDALKEKQEYQKQIAHTYTDGKTIYITLRSDLEDSVNVEKLKKIFDIEDGAIRENKDNDLNYTWIKDDRYPGGGCMDYTRNWIEPGDTIQIKANKINSEIDLKNYKID